MSDPLYVRVLLDGPLSSFDVALLATVGKRGTPNNESRNLNTELREYAIRGILKAEAVAVERVPTPMVLGIVNASGLLGRSAPLRRHEGFPGWQGSPASSEVGIARVTQGTDYFITREAVRAVLHLFGTVHADLLAWLGDTVMAPQKVEPQQIEQQERSIPREAAVRALEGRYPKAPNMLGANCNTYAWLQEARDGELMWWLSTLERLFPIHYKHQKPKQVKDPHVSVVKMR